MGYCRGVGCWRNWVSSLKSYDGLAVQTFHNFDQSTQINRMISSTEKLNEACCLKQPGEATVQELEYDGLKKSSHFNDEYLFI